MGLKKIMAEFQRVERKLKVLVTGASGRIGERLVYWLERETPCDLILTSRKKPVFNSRRSVWVPGDLLNTLDLDKIFLNQPDVIVHLASTVGKKNSSSIANFENTELIPTLQLLDYILSKNIRVKFIFASSGGTVYKDSINAHFETDPVHGSSLYSCNKIFVENLLWLYKEVLHPVILRISNPFGMKINPNSRQGIIDVAVNCAINNQTFDVYGSLNNIRDFVHIDDLCLSFIKAIYFSGSDYEIFNIGSGVGTSIYEIVQYVKKYFPKFKFTTSNRNINDDIACNILDVSKAFRLLGWQSTVSVEDYLKNKSLQNR